MGNGTFIISLDFELMWGVQESKGMEAEDYVRRVHDIIPRLVNLFDEFEVKATFCIVGALLFDSYQDFEPHRINPPKYKNKRFSPYYLEDEISDPRYRDLFFAKSLIRNVSHHEIGTHTFSHFYTLEEGQTFKDFKSDLTASMDVATKEGYEMKSIIFPRNQVNDDYLIHCKDRGLICYRGTEQHWAYHSKSRSSESLKRRSFRLLDSYINLSGCHIYDSKNLVGNKTLFNVPSSRFFRPYNSRLAIFEVLKLNRILRSMKKAAIQGKMYHLWWHPHNFSNNTERNFQQLRRILNYYKNLNVKFEFESLTMSEFAKSIENEN